MDINFDAWTKNPETVLDYITCTGPRGTFNISWDTSYGDAERRMNAVHYNLQAVADVISEDNDATVRPEDAFELIRSMTHFCCCLRDKNNERPVRPVLIPLSLTFWDWVDDEFVEYHVPERLISVEGLEVVA